MAKMQTMDLEALLKRHQSAAVGSFNGTIGQHRAELMKRYLAAPYGDEVDGRSKVVDTGIRDTIESIKPDLMDIFVGGDRVVDFAPRGPEDADAARQETDICNYIFMQQNDGFMVLYNWITDALFQKVGYVKRYWDERKRVEIEEYDELLPDEAAELLADIEASSEEVEVLERAGGIDEETGAVEPMYLKLRRTSVEKRYTVENVPPEEVLVSPTWTRVDFKHCPFVAHKRAVPVSDLIEMGFDRKRVEDLPTFDRKLETEEAQVRFSEQEFTESSRNVADDSMREVLVYENYVLCDYDGDGIAEQLQVFTDGQGSILKRNGAKAIEYVTDAPFEAFCALPIPHRHYGLSVAELVQDLQKIKTVMTRQLIDNVVGSNNPDIVYDEDQASENTVTALSQTGFARNIPMPGGLANIGPMPIPQTAAQSLAAIEYVDSLRETRTGVTRYNQGIDADSLAPLAQGTVKNMMTAAQKKILMIARILAETGFKSLFVNMHRDLRAGPVKEMAVMLNNDFVQVNPRKWRGRSDVMVSVGLGTGDKDVQIARLQQILAEQKEALAYGVTDYSHVYGTYRRILELSGFKDVGSFFPSPDDVAQRPPQEEKPDPTMILAQIEMQKAQAQAQTKMAELELRKMEAQTKRLDVLMKDDRERDLAAAKIEADEAARMQQAVNGANLVR